MNESNKTLTTSSQKFGAGHPCFVVAEIGINHNGDMGLAFEEIAAAAEAGADSVKFQSYRTEDFIFDRSLMLEYQSQNKKIVEPQYDIFKRCELSRDQIYRLKEEAERHGLDFHSTPTSVGGIEILKDIGCAIVKNGSDYLSHVELIRAMGESGLITVLSTGMATVAEIDNAVRVFRETGNDKLILLHCTSSYPKPPEDVNLVRISTLKTVFNVPVGFSDHSVGSTAAIGATILGACWIEKHFTLDRSLPGPDHWFSMDPGELHNLVSAVREAERMVGTPHITPTESEVQGRRNFRLSCVAARDIEAGETVRHEDILFQRPGEGIQPAHTDFITGLKLQQPLKKGEQYTKEHFRE